jgi:ubiquinone/menaquinone biosynthesis C-methylase UbiE
MNMTDVLDQDQEQKIFWSDFSADYHKILYKSPEGYPSLIMRQKYILELLDPPPASMIDIGCGPGEMLVSLIDRGYRAHGIDISEGMLTVAAKNLSEKHPGNDVVLQCGNIEKLALRSGTFDGVICAGVIEYLDSDDKALRELNRILRKGGALVITVRNKACLPRIFDTLFDTLKEKKAGFVFINRVLKRLGREESKYTSYRKHFPWRFDKNLETELLRRNFRYSNFLSFFANVLSSCSGIMSQDWGFIRRTNAYKLGVF